MSASGAADFPKCSKHIGTFVVYVGSQLLISEVAVSKEDARAEEYLSDGQACELLHVTSRTTLRWRVEGNGPPFVRAGGRRILYRRSDLETWLSARTFIHRAAEASSPLPARPDPKDVALE
jgi:excisionase family DNA binding protein